MVFNNMLLWGDSGVMDTVTVTIAGRNVVKEYDGSTQSVSGYTVTSISDPNYTASDFIFSGSAAASGKNVGTYNMNLTASQFTNVNTRFKNVVFTVTDGYVRVTPKNVTVAAVAKSKTYDNNASTDPTLTATVTGLIGADTITYTLSRVSGQNAGQYTITPSGNATQGNYVVNYSTAKFTINPASCTLTANSGTKTYNGANQSVTGYTCSVSGLAFSGVSASGSGTNAGTYAVKFSGVTVNTTKDTTGNYKVTGTTNGVLTINPASCTLTANSGTRTYNGSNQSVTGFSSSPSGLSFSGVSASGTGKNAGIYSVTFSGVTVNTTKDTTGNYKVTGTTNGTLTINKAALGLSISNYSGTYNGSAHTITATTSVTSGTTIYYSTDNTNWSTTKPTRTVVGTTTVYVKAQNSDTNYNVATGTGTITITKAAASGLGLSVSGYSGTYDGSSHTITATVSVSSGTTLYYRTSTTASWSTTKPSRTAVGTTTVYVEARNDNYNTASGNANIVINSKAVTVKADNKSKTYGQNDPTLTATVTGTVGSDSVSYTLSRAAGSNVGNYTITPSGNATQGNYTVTYQTGTFTISKASAASLGLSVTSYDGMYNGSNHSVTATVAVSSGTTIYYRTSTTGAWSTTNPSFKDIGYHDVYVKAENGNYNTATANGYVYITSNVLISLSSETTFHIQSQTGTYESDTYTLPAGQFWFDYLSPGKYYFVNETSGTYSLFTTNNYTYVTVP